MRNIFIHLKVIFVIISLLLLLVTAIYLAGFIFLLISKTNPFKVDLTTYYQYWHHYYHIDVFYQKRLHIAGILSLAITLCTPLMLYCSFKREQKQNSLFGNAHWASQFEAKKAGLFKNKGLIIGKKWGRYLMVGGYEHVFVFAPSGSGKTNALVIPNLLQWNGSCIVQDFKLTLFNLTSKFRQMHGQKCFVWNPASREGMTHAYNPLDFVSKDKILRIDDLQKIAHILI